MIAAALTRVVSTALPARQLATYAAVGVVITLLDFALFVLLVQTGGGYAPAKAASACLGMVAGYALNERLTFQAGRRVVGLLRYGLVACAGLALNLALLGVLVEGAALAPVPAQAVAIPVVAVATFVANRRWTFRSGRAAPAR